MQLHPTTSARTASTVAAPMREPAVPAPFAVRDEAWVGGILLWSNAKLGTRRSFLALDAVLGRPDGYDSVRDARAAALTLSTGPDRPAVAIAEDGDGRVRVYAAGSRFPEDAAATPLAFEQVMPRLPSGAMLDFFVWAPADGLVEVRDGERVLYPNWG